MKKACGLQLALYLVLAAAVGAIVYRRFPVGPPAIMAAVFGGFAVYLGVAYLLGIRGKIAEAGMIRRARAGDSPRDGEKIAAIGRLVPNGSPLVSPLTKSPAVAYKYEIQSPGKRSSLLYSGFALTPSTIQGSQRGMKLLAYPELDVKARYMWRGEAVENFREYVRSTEFRDPQVGRLRESVAEMMAQFKDDDGSIRIDQKMTRSEPNLENARYTEWVVRPGDQVCVIGHYSVQRGGVVHDPAMPLQQVKIQLGEPDAFAGRAVRGAVGYLIAGIIFLTASIAGLTWFYAYIPLEASEQMAPEMKTTWPEIRLERLIENRVRVPMRQRGMLDTGTVSNLLTEGSATGRVGDVFLSRAEAVRTNHQTTISLDGDAVVLTIDDRNQPIRLRLLRTEIPRDEFRGALDLRITEKSDEYIAGRITFLSNRPDLPASRAAFRARVSSRAG